MVLSPVSDQSENADFYVTFLPTPELLAFLRRDSKKKVRPDLAGFYLNRENANNFTIEQPVFRETFFRNTFFRFPLIRELAKSG